MPTRRTMPIAPALLLVLAALPGGLPCASAQEFHDYDLSLEAAEEPACVIACAPDGALLVAWEEAPGRIFTRLLRGTLREAVDHGPGRDPALVGLGDGFVLAFAEITTVRVVQGNGETWGAPVAIAGGGREVTRPDLAAAPGGADAELYLVWQENSTRVHFSQRQAGDWASAEVVIYAEPIFGDAAPQVGPTLDGGTIVPRVYFYDGLARLRYKERSGGLWGDWQGIPGPNFALDGDIAWDGALLHYVVSTEPDHACPCNHLHYARELADGEWTPVVDLDVVLDEFNWPRHPSIVVDEEDVPRVFWYQVFHDGDELYTGEQMYYFACEAGLWVDHSEVVDDRVGISNALALDPQGRPAFAWAEEGERSRSVVLRRFETTADVPSVPGGARLRLAASPIPSAGGVVLRLAESAPPASRLELFDAAGRRVRCWAQGLLPSGAVTWDGLDRTGRRAPAGVYQARVTSGAERATVRLILVD